ncbi:MAG: hypothetical protein ABI688_06145, partial [Bacteroidota bacterium]
MKKLTFAFIPVLLAGFLLPEDNCRQTKLPGIIDSDQYDGPYVLYKADKLFVKYIDSGTTKSVRQDSMALSERTNLSFTVMTDEPGKTFSVKLKPELENEKSEYNKVTKQFVVSDIEGNFRAFRRLLQANNVIDTNFNWTFGTGHLVLTGDFVDRG